MKKLVILFFILSLQLFAQFGEPKIVPHEKEFNFGDVKAGEVVSHNFIIFNRGGDVLKITRVKASCGCTAAEPAKTELAPEDSTIIKVEFNTKRRKGKQKKYVYIFSNDPETPQLRLLFHANVIAKDNSSAGNKPILKLSKYSHNFGNVMQGEILDLTIDVINSGLANLEIKKVKTSCGCTAALMSNKIIKSNESNELKIEFDTKNLLGQISRTVTLFSNDPKNPTRVLTLIANIDKG